LNFLNVQHLRTFLEMFSSNLKEAEPVIIGGESDLKPRPIKPEWVREIRDDCLGIPFFLQAVRR